MPEIGQTLAHYSITEKIGKGGMGEVFRAKDQKLGRDVAIKVLPEEFAKDADRVARFQREAKLLASLNHPNIAAIHGLEESGGTQFLVLELVEGDTLADRIKGGPIPVEEALKLALQIAEALEAAHEKGVIHRDLKPANIKVTPDGKVKVLDFGLAKAFAGEHEEVNLSHSPTLSDMATMQGVILGTAAYMSPEQARGKPVDKRTDIWAFGCALYEMLTGKAAFQGEDVTEILAAVVKSGVNLDLLPANINPIIREVLDRCLQKDLKKRYQDIGDVRYEMAQALVDSNGAPVTPLAAVGSPIKMRRIFSWIAAIAILGAIAGGVVVWNYKPKEQRQVARFTHYLPENQQFANNVYSLLAVSPDGRQFAYGTTGGLLLRSLGDLEVRRVSDGHSAMPFFSPDDQWIGYLSSDNKLKKVSINGGTPVPLGDVPGDAIFLGASWSEDDTIVYGQIGKGIMRIAAGGGIPETLVKPEKDGNMYHPRLLPDGKSVLFTLGPPPYRIAVQSIKSSRRKILFPGNCAWYLRTGHIVYGLDESLYAAPFDLKTLQSGASVPVVEGLFQGSPTYVPQYAVSGSGTLLYVPKAMASTVTTSTLVWVDRNGKEERIEAPSNSYSGLRISPDGTRVALAAAINGNSDIYVWDLIRKVWNRLTFNKGIESNPLWTRDGKRIVFASLNEGDSAAGVCWKSADGTGKDEPVAGSLLPLAQTLPYSWSDDGKTLVLVGNFYAAGTANYNIGILATEGDSKIRLLLKEKFYETQAQISPNGRWMVYVSNESGQAQIYVRPFPEADKGRWQVSMSGGYSPLWSRDGRELFYRNSDAVMAVSVKTEPTFSFETPRSLFRGTFRPGASTLSNQWDVGPDGRFLMMKETGVVAPTVGNAPRMNVVLNWFEELKQRVPTK